MNKFNVFQRRMIFRRSAATAGEREGETPRAPISWGRKGEMRWPDLKEGKPPKREGANAFFLPRQFKNSERAFPLNKAQSRFTVRDFYSQSTYFEAAWK
jgi:hypothetical protein